MIKDIPTKGAAEELKKEYKNNADGKAFDKLRVVEQPNGKYALTNKE